MGFGRSGSLGDGSKHRPDASTQALMTIEPPTGSAVALPVAATGIPERVNGLVDDGPALKLDVSV